MNLGHLVPCHVSHLSAPECHNCKSHEEFRQLMKTLADLVAAQADTAKAIADLAARIPVATPPEDLTPAVDAELAFQASLAAIAPAPVA